ncbi:MAG: hypothetical protein ABIJ09_04040 [Pseudomonadota bacterium]
MALLLCTAPARAVAPLQDWHSLPSACCDVHYPARLEALARRVAVIADEADTAVAGLLGARPSDRVQIVLEDESDYANGWALTVPYNTLHVYAVAPDDLSPLGDSDDWLRGLVLHEYTHIVHMDTVGGVPRAVQRIIGKQWSPNQVQPRWFIEGLAIYVESRFSTGGRVRSSVYDMYLRAAALEDRLWSLNALSSEGRAFPRGSAPYLYGGRFLAYLAERRGEAIFADISARYGAQLVPFGLNRAGAEALGESYDVLYQDFLNALRERAGQVRDRVQSLGPDASVRRTHLGETVSDPVRLPSGEVLFFAAPADDSAGLYRLRPGQAEPERLLELQGDGGMSVLPDGRLLLSQPEIFDDHYAFHDLYLVDPASGHQQRLTHGLRAVEPAAFADGRRALFVRRDANQSALAEIDLERGTVRELHRFDDGSQFYTPAIAPDGRFAVVSLWRPGGNRDLWRVDLNSGQLLALTADRAADLHPAFSSSGRHVLFSSDRDGVFNIHALELASGQVHQVTNVVTGAFFPRPSANGRLLTFVGFTADGFDLYQLDADKILGYPSPPSYDRALSVRQLGSSDNESSGYNPLPTLWPHAWYPLFTGDLSGPAFGAAVAGSDAVGLHEAAVQVTWGASSGHLNADLGYGYNDLPLPLRLTLRRTEYTQNVRPNVELDAVPSTIQGYGVEVTTLWPRVRWLRSHVFGASYGLTWTLRPDPLPFEPDLGRPLVSWTGRTAALRLFWSYRDTRRFADSVSTERGVALAASLRVAHPYLGSQAEFIEVSGDARLYLQVPGLRGHVVAVLAQGGYAAGPREQRRLYAAGGIPQRNIVDDLLLGGGVGGGYLRGYPVAAFVGDGALTGSVEYRWPLWTAQWGYSTLPLFLDRFSAVAFGDLGGAFLEVPRAQDLLHRSVGGELRARVVLGYRLPLELRLGLARGLDERGLEIQPYAVVGASY